MKFELRNYQSAASDSIINKLGTALNRYATTGDLTAVSLSAATGAGKTVIAAAAIEAMFYGSGATPPNPNLTLLWVTDDPSLNHQTRNKMLIASSQIKAGQLVAIDQSFDQKTLDPGKVYFLNIQKLGSKTSYVKTGDSRKYTVWQSIANTISERPDEFVLIVDEAHKGTAPKPQGVKTIVASLIDGSDRLSLPAPAVVLGISATPKRFVDSVSATGNRSLDFVKVPIEDVRESGLLKDKIRVRHPDEKQPGDLTLLGLAVQDLRNFTTSWQEYSKSEDEPAVQPALVVQVKAKTSDTHLATILSALLEGWSELDGKAVAHSFEGHKALDIGGRTVRYVAPHRIQDDPHLKVVLFKEALTTGWDCPRAEVMCSFRSAEDFTYIAQLIGRMVRTPLAKRIATDGVLNTVSLYLPHYDAVQVNTVIESLRSGENETASEIEVEAVICERNKNAGSEVWDLLAKLPTYTRPGKYHRNNVSRLNALAMLLVRHHLDEDATKTARTQVTGTLALEASKSAAELKAKIADFKQLEWKDHVYDYKTGEVTTSTGSVAVAARNIEDLFRAAKRRLGGDAAAHWYWDDLVEADEDAQDAKVQVAALAHLPQVPGALEVAAGTLIDTWRKKHSDAIASLKDTQRAEFYEIWSQGKKPEEIRLVMPSRITAASKRVVGKGDKKTVEPIDRHEKHIYVNGKKTYPASLTSWEAGVLAHELKEPTLRAWYRNPTGGPAALAIPYEQSGTKRTLYPDFLFFHEDDDGELVVDVIDPHRPDGGDTGPKWLGLADYAADHGASFRRIVAVIESKDGKLLSLDLKNKNVAAPLKAASNELDIREVFDKLGGNY